MKKYLSLIITILITFTSLLTVNGASSSPNGGGGTGGSGGGGGAIVVYPILSSGFVCQNQYCSINFDTGEISLKNFTIDFSDDVILKGNEVLCPARPFLETLQFAVSYNAFDLTITATLNDTTMIIPIEGNTITVNGVNYYTEYPAKNIYDVQYIPASAILTALGYVEVSVGIGENIITYAENCVTYRLLGNGTMTIEGVGVIPDYNKTEIKPWDDFASRIKKIIIDDGVTAIGNYAFNNCENLISVEIPDTVTKINKYAFPKTVSFVKIKYNGTFDEWNLINIDNNSNTKYVIVTYSNGYVDYAPAEDFEVINGVIVKYLGSSPVIHIPDEIKGVKIIQIGERAFENITDCYHITIPDTVSKIGYGAFWNCYNLRTINIPDGITELDGTFTDCSSLHNIDLPDTITTIGKATFQYCESLTSLCLSNVTSIGVAAFGNSGITSFDIPGGVTAIPRSAFHGCENLTEVNMCQGLKTIGMFAFEGCTKLTAIDIPSTVEIIGDGAFNSCEYITEIELPKLDYISDGLFYNCYRLQDVIIPKTITKIYSGAFTNCYSLTNVHYTGSQTEWQQITINEDNDYLTYATIHYNYTGTSECIVEFNTNGGNGYFSPFTISGGSVIELPEDVFSREHHKFLGWAFTSSATKAEILPLEEYIVEESVVFYAVWEPLPYIETTIDEYSNYSLGTTTIYNAPSNCILNIAAYYDGRLVSLESRPYTKNTETYAINEAYDTIEIMLWNSLTNLKPLCDTNCISKAGQAFLALCNSTGDYQGIYEALRSSIYDYNGKSIVNSLDDDEKVKLAKEMFHICPIYTTIKQFENTCNEALEIFVEPVPGYGGGAVGGGGTSNTVESAGTIRT